MRPTTYTDDSVMRSSTYGAVQLWILTTNEITCHVHTTTSTVQYVP